MRNQLLTSAVAATVAAISTTGVNGNADVMETIIESLDRAYARGIVKMDPLQRPQTVRNAPVECVDGHAVVDGESFDCSGVDFLSFFSYADMEIKSLPHLFDAHSADIWGWESPSGKNIVTFAMDNGVALVDVSEPLNPCVMVRLPTARSVDIWADVKVMNNTLYHVKDKRGGDVEETANIGIEVYDLLQFDAPEFDCHAAGFEAGEAFPNFITTEHGRSHNAIINPDSQRLYTVGSRICASGLAAYDASNRLEPIFLGCADADGYTHDAQCITYPSDGPDQRFVGNEICFAFNEDTLTIWDMTNMENVTMLSRTPYPNQAYSHQGWVNKDITKVLLDDELDELCNFNMDASRRCALGSDYNGLLNTSTDIFDITDLTNPILESVYVHRDIAIDHNLYVWGDMHARGWTGNAKQENAPDPNFAYLHNYVAGLRILNISSTDSSEWREVAYFDVAPDLNGELEFLGAWSGYMFSDGTYVVSSIDRGLFVLNTSTAFPAAPVTPPVATSAPTQSTGCSDSLDDQFFSFTSSDLGMIVGLSALGGFVLAALLFGVVSAVRKSPASKAKAQSVELQAKAAL